MYYIIFKALIVISERSAGASKNKLKKMGERNTLMETVKNEAADVLVKGLTKDAEKYKRLLKELLLQGLLKLMEQDIVIRCRKSDKDLVNSILIETCKTYIDRIKKEVPKMKAKDINPKIKIDEANYLPELNPEPGKPSW
jgi:V-type H+-transporting ATPase subunit E